MSDEEKYVLRFFLIDLGMILSFIFMGIAISLRNYIALVLFFIISFYFHNRLIKEVKGHYESP